jgi:RNA polymerase sigma-70 factor (ECF subfamily)
METSLGGSNENFASTRWSLLDRGDVQEILRLYWRPIYAHLRRRGHSIEDAKDLTQEFFTNFLQKNVASQADRSRGRFRSFLRAAVDHFASDVRDRQSAQKRGGDARILDVEAAERTLSTEDTPEREFDRQWARALLDDAMDALAQEYQARGQAEKFREIRPHLVDGSCEDRVALHRARQRIRELVRRRVALTVGSRGEIDEELSELLNSL